MQILNHITAPDGRRIGIYPPCLEGHGSFHGSLADDGIDLACGEFVRLEGWQVSVLKMCWSMSHAHRVTLVLADTPPPRSVNAGPRSYIVEHGSA